MNVAGSGVGDGVTVGVAVLVGVCVAVGAGVFVGVAVGVGVWVAVAVAVAVAVGVDVLVAVGAASTDSVAVLPPAMADNDCVLAGVEDSAHPASRSVTRINAPAVHHLEVTITPL